MPGCRGSALGIWPVSAPNNDSKCASADVPEREAPATSTTAGAFSLHVAGVNLAEEYVGLHVACDLAPFQYSSTHDMIVPPETTRDAQPAAHVTAFGHAGTRRSGASPR